MEKQLTLHLPLKGPTGCCGFEFSGFEELTLLPGCELVCKEPPLALLAGLLELVEDFWIWGEVAAFGGAVDGSRGCELLGHGASGRFWGGLFALLGRSGSFEGGFDN